MTISAHRRSFLRLGPLGAMAIGVALSGCGAVDDGDRAGGVATAVESAQISAGAAEAETPAGDQPQTSPLSVRIEAGTAGASTAESASTTRPTTRSTESSITSSTTGASTASTTTARPAQPSTTAATTPATGATDGSPQEVRIRFESMVGDVPVADLRAAALAVLNDPRGWGQAGFTFVSDSDGPYRVVLAEGAVVDQLCLPLKTYGTVSCQNGAVVALNADRWRNAVDHWVLGVEVYRGYLVNHEVGHLIGQRHPKPRCPVRGRPAGVMEQQTAGLEGCIGNPWPRQWELEYAARRPVVYAPLPDWGPDPVPSNRES